MLPGELEHKVYCGGVKEFNHFFLKKRPTFQTLGISYFGNEHTDKPMNKAKHLEMWKTLLWPLRQREQSARTHFGHVVLAAGTYAAKYGYCQAACQAYDDNMEIIRRRIREIDGFEVRTDFQLVKDWPLAADELHFDVACLSAVAK